MCMCIDAFHVYLVVGSRFGCVYDCVYGCMVEKGDG